MASVNTLCKSVLNVKNTVIKNCNLYSDKNGVKHIRIQARPNKWHENDCPFCHKSCPVYDKHSSSIMPRYYEDNSSFTVHTSSKKLKHSSSVSNVSIASNRSCTASVCTVFPMSKLLFDFHDFSVIK